MQGNEGRDEAIHDGRKQMRVKGSPKYLLVGLIFIVLVNDVVLLTLFS